MWLGLVDGPNNNILGDSWLIDSFAGAVVFDRVALYLQILNLFNSLIL